MMLQQSPGGSRRALRGACAAVALSLLLAACSSGSGGDAADADKSGLPAAQKLVDKQLQAPTSVGVDVPLSKRPDSNEVFAVVAPNNPLNVARTEGMKQAAQVLGWDFKSIVVGTGAEDVQRAIQSALQLNPPPSVIAVMESPKSTYLPQLADAKSRGIPIISNSSLDPAGTGDGIAVTINEAKNSLIEPEQIAAEVAVSSEGSATLALFDIPSIPIVHNSANEIIKYLKQYCPSCSTKVIPIQVGDLGTAAPQNVVSQLQKNPDIDYVYMLGAATAGVPAALKAAGYADKVRLVGLGPEPANIQGLRDNDQINYAWSAFSPTISGWQTVDVAARIVNKDNLEPVSALVSPTQIVTAANVNDIVEDSEGSYIGVADYESIFKKMWLVQ